MSRPDRRSTGPWAARDGGLALRVRLQPKATRSGFDGLGADAEGTQHVRARVSAAPEGGRANRALIKLVAGALKLPASDISIAAGVKARRKTLMSAGEPGALGLRVEQWLEDMA